MTDEEKKKIRNRITRFLNYQSHSNDLTSVIKLCEYVMENYENDKNLLIISSLYRYAVITYGKSFVSGSRYMIPESIFKDLPGELIVAHHYFLDFRNKSIAHREDSYDTINAGIQKDVTGKIVNILSIETKKMIDDVEGVIQLKLLASKIIEHLSKRIENEKEKVMNIIQDNEWLDTKEPMGASINKNGDLEIE
jgi:hypothetical protein